MRSQSPEHVIFYTLILKFKDAVAEISMEQYVYYIEQLS
jgi:hypothetical protein